jgi:hypothetical protein
MGEWRKTLTVLGLLAVFAPVWLPPAFGCECGWVRIMDGKRVLSDIPPPLTYDEYLGYVAVFQGTVARLDIRRIPNHTCDGCVTEDVVVIFAVSKVWKGDVAIKYQVRTPRGGAACEFTFTPGVSYLVYVKEGSPDWNYGVTRCSRTKRSADGRDESVLLDGFQVSSQSGNGRRDP